MVEDLINALRRIAKVSYGATIEEARSVSKTQREAADLLEQQSDRLTALESERDALLAAAGKEAVAVDAQRMTEIARKWIKEGSEASPEFYWGDFYDCVREIIAAGDGRDAWQPIDTAPKDGRTVLLGYLNSAGKWRTTRGQWMSEEYIAECWEEPDDVEPGWFETAEEAEDMPNCWRIEPTHWQPLPAPPAALPQKAGER